MTAIIDITQQPQLVEPLKLNRVQFITLSSSTMRNYTEATLAAALNAVQNGQSVKSASKDYGVPRSTLQGRRNGSENTRTAHEH